MKHELAKGVESHLEGVRWDETGGVCVYEGSEEEICNIFEMEEGWNI